MTRKLKTTCQRNHPAGSRSEKEDKKRWHRKYRRKAALISAKLARQNDGTQGVTHEGKNDFPLVSEITDPWQMGKDRSEG